MVILHCIWWASTYKEAAEKLQKFEVSSTTKHIILRLERKYSVSINLLISLSLHQLTSYFVIKEQSRIYWTDGMPYMMKKQIVRESHHGKDRHKRFNDRRKTFIKQVVLSFCFPVSSISEFQ